MSITLPIVDLSAATVGTTDTVSWFRQAGGIQSQATYNNQATIWIFNESPCGLQLVFQTGEQPFLPAGGWLPVTLQPSCMQYSYTVVYTMTGAQVNSLITVYFAPGELVPSMPLLGNSPVGGTVGNIIAQYLEGPDATSALTSLDQGNGDPTLLPGQASRGLMLAASGLLAPNGVPFDVDGLHIKTNGQLEIFQGISFLNGFTAGLYGVPPIVAVANAHVTSTTQQTLIDYAPGAAGLFRASIGIALNNGTSGQNVTAAVTYSGQAASGSHRFAAVQNGATTVVVLDGATSRTNGDYACMPHTFYATTASDIQVIYRDPANTPNDQVWCILEQLQ